MAKNNWFYDSNGVTMGPVTVRQLRQLATSGQLQPTDRVRKEDMDRWVKAQAVKGLFGPPMLSSKAEPGDGDTVFDFLGNAATVDSDEESAEQFRPEFDFFSGASSAPPAPRKSNPPPKPTPSHERPPLPPTMKRPSVAGDQPIRMAEPILVDDDPQPIVASDIPMAEVVVEEDASFALAEEVPLAAPIDMAEFGTRPDLSGPEVALKSDGAAETTGATLALTLHKGWLTARATMPDGAEQESYLRVDRIDAVKFRARPGVGGANGKARVLSFHTGWQCVALLCEDQDSAVRAFVDLVMAGV